MLLQLEEEGERTLTLDLMHRSAVAARLHFEHSRIRLPVKQGRRVRVRARGRAVGRGRVGVGFAFCSLGFSFTEFIHAASVSIWCVCV